MREIKTKEEFRKLFHYDHKGTMYIFVITESIIITKEVMDSLPFETLRQIWNDELSLIRKKILGKAEDARLH